MSGSGFSLDAVAFATPGAIDTVSGGYAYARRILALTPFKPLALPEGFPDPDAPALAETAALLSARPGPLVIDGLAYGAFPAELADAVGGRSVVLLHHPLDLEGDTPRDVATVRAARERRALAAARGVIATSPATARDLAARFGVEGMRVAVAEPGVAPASRAPASGHPPRLLCVGAVIPRKGHDLLVRAFSRLPRALHYQLDIVGPLDRAPAYEQALREAIVAAGLDDRIRLRGALSETALEQAYAEADLALAPSRHEGYGMAAAEAIARGLPLIAGRGGALAETAAAGVVVDPEDAPRFAETLGRLIGDREARRAAADRAWAAAARLPRWEDTAQRVMAAVRRFLGDAQDREAR